MTEPQTRRRKRRKPKKKRALKITMAIILVLILGVGAYAYSIWHSVEKTFTQTHEPLNRDVSEKRSEKVSFSKRDPISILLLGVDQRAGDRGRSDSLILMTVNPKDQSMKMVSIPRDTRTEIVGKGTTDKINHAYAFGGVDMAVNTVEKFLDVPVDYYVQVNMESFKDIVDAVGGVTVNNDLNFDYDGYSFKKGNLTLDGKEALAYSRMRKQDPRGDFGRQMRQRQIIEGVIEEGASVQSLANYGTILDTIGTNVRTNLTFDDMKQIQSNYKDARHNVEQLQVDGKGEKINGIYYYAVSDATRQALSSKLKQHLNIN
ncbi:LytR family transcriptional regulator [Priestia megaterium]|jgi:LCP family protein required for cell wall assembly|uniref:polyisoprenyl-teichoic acid--peptidoglycan teichoic acid transferase TagU n=1 Tax=Priestia TaxID=2800373 RepID=UPI0009909ABF|nr:LytR family transcriptional regulator [Priestia megaterium]MBZ5479335.1 LytR family transcriptional regulator [Bacillus sp. T_4]AQU72818.1 LytR family transcriptional regulator [Priestia megaterium]MBM6601042.1 LytR family transcriptional regulator [Priestia megaterium]MCA4155859.1 LytR family transcriptional regulator [Priestia megaterium]MCR8865101.1 LytR family transcriptional regulator [Priestia megaterium]